jgi:capsular polysaccharide export protein
MRRPTIAFIDPGPNLVQFLVGVGKRLAPDDRAVFFSLHVKSRSLLRRLGQEVHPWRRAGRADGWPESFAIDSAALIARLRKSSDRDLVRQRAPTFCWLVRELDHFLEATQPKGVFIWNGSGLATALTVQLARARGIPLLFAENGYLPNTLQLDPEGVNAFASIGGRISLSDIQALSYSDAQIRDFDRLVADYRAGKSPRRCGPESGRIRPSLLAYMIQGWNDLRQRPPAIRANQLIPRGTPALPERFVFFPLQVKNDSQLTIHSPLYGNRLDAAITDLEQAVRELDPALSLVVKLHPADLKKTDYDPVARAFPGVIWVGAGAVRALLERATCVVTVNSTVGIEAMLFGKPVVTLGDNFYVRAGLVHPVRNRGELASQLAHALREPPDAALIRQYLLYLYCVAFVRAHWRDHSPESVGNLAERVAAMIQEINPARSRADGG